MSHQNLRQWVQCTKANPCPACGKEHDCTLSTDGLLSKCMWAPGGKEINQRDGRIAYLRRVSECLNGGRPPKSPGKPPKQARRFTPKELDLIIKQTRTALSARRLTIAAKDLGVSEKSLLSLGVGWYSDYDCLSFPMFNGSGKPIGVRLRLSTPGANGRRYICVPGSQNGLFIPDSYYPREIPAELTNDSAPLVLLMPEGPTDVAAAIDLGFQAVGRPSNSGGQMLVHHLLNAAPCKVDLVIFADQDATKFLLDGTPFWPGWEGALSVAECVASHPNLSKLKIVTPPRGAGKDLRDWMRDGGTVEMLVAILTSADVVTPAWLARKQKALNAIKRETKRLMDTKQTTDRDAALRMAKEKLIAAPRLAG